MLRQNAELAKWSCWGAFMPSAEYYLRQADICIRLSRARSDKGASARLLILAETYAAMAEEMAGGRRCQCLTTVLILDKPRPEKVTWQADA